MGSGLNLVSSGSGVPDPEQVVTPTPVMPEEAGGVGAAQAQFLVGLVTTGALDDHLGTLQAAISRRHRERYRDESNRKAAELTVGDRVRLTRDIRPQYLRGMTGTVVGWASTNVVVRLDDATGRFTSGELRCPPLGLERISSR